jgi:hypothetical protein
MPDEGTKRNSAFADAGLSEPLLLIISEVGYETPTPTAECHTAF